MLRKLIFLLLILPSIAFAGPVGGGPIAGGGGGGSITNADTATIIDTTSATSWCVFVDTQTGTVALKTDGECTYNASTGVMTIKGLVVGSGGITASKQSGTAGRSFTYEANSTDTNGTGWRVLVNQDQEHKSLPKM
jgi:hypothetical protein